MVDPVPSPQPPRLPEGRVLLTGATGFLGGALVRRLRASGIPPDGLRCLVRDRARAERAGLPGESLVSVDLADPGAGEGLRRAVADVGVVVNLAGTLQATNRRGFDRVNVHGTQRLLEAVRSAAPDAHFIQVSSLAAAGPSTDGRGSDAPPDRCRTVSRYGESKRLGELAVVASGLSFTVLRPPVVYGPNDGATRMLFRQALAPVVFVPRRPRPLSVIHASDVAEALWLALCRRPRGVFLPLDGPERTDTHALLDRIAAACGHRARRVPVPMALAAVAAGVADVLARVRGRAGYFNRDKVREIAADGWVAHGRAAARELAFRPAIGLDDGLRRVAIAEGFVRDS